MDPERVLQIGKIVGVFGVNGEIKVFKMAEEPAIFDPGRRVMLREAEGWYTPYTIKTVKAHKKILRICFEEIGDRSGAENLVGAGLFIHRSALPETDADTYYWCDLIGLDVFGAAGEYIGRVTSMIATGSNDVFVVTAGNTETLVPAIGAVVVDIDIENGRMRVDLPEGL